MWLKILSLFDIKWVALLISGFIGVLIALSISYVLMLQIKLDLANTKIDLITTTNKLNEFKSKLLQAEAEANKSASLAKVNEKLRQDNFKLKTSLIAKDTTNENTTCDDAFNRLFDKF